ncbi:unnamed protein product [Lymnaea stagnalis]|uniref:Uncharacterized protein n=1 Tax=Lymnaea stagnalis TaxID=6523 RepID=A0AAV2IAP6_LYMST
MAKFVTAFAILLIVCLGEFSALGEDLPDNVEEFVNQVDSKIDASIDTLNEFFKSAKRNVGQRVRRSWWDDNKDWIVPVGSSLLLGRDASSREAKSVETAKRAFLQSVKRNVGHRVRRSWWDDNKDWIVPLGSNLLLGRDAELKSLEAAKRADPVSKESLDQVNDAIDFLKTLTNVASKASQAQQK